MIDALKRYTKDKFSATAIFRFIGWATGVILNAIAVNAILSLFMGISIPMTKFVLAYLIASSAIVVSAILFISLVIFAVGVAMKLRG